MPKKIQQKSKEEISAEGYFPVDEEDLKKTTEKQVREFVPEIPKRVTEKLVRSQIDIQSHQDIYCYRRIRPS